MLHFVIFAVGVVGFWIVVVILQVLAGKTALVLSSLLHWVLGSLAVGAAVGFAGGVLAQRAMERRGLRPFARRAA